MTRSISKLVSAAALAVALTGVATTSFADTQWQKDHPRRAQVNHRLANQNARIHQERKDGQINGRQAAQLHREDHAIRTEERTMARTDGGHITKAEHRALNQQENQVSRQIGP